MLLLLAGLATCVSAVPASTNPELIKFKKVSLPYFSAATLGSGIIYSLDSGSTRGSDDVFYFTNFCNRQLGFQVYLFNSLVQCLFISSTRTDFSSARQICTDKGSRLYIARSQEKLGLLRHIVTNITLGTTWLGLNDLINEGVYVWEDGQTVNTTTFPVPWRIGQPDNAGDREDCVEMGSYMDLHYVNDQYCGEMANFICEVDVI